MRVYVVVAIDTPGVEVFETYEDAEKFKEENKQSRWLTYVKGVRKS